VKASDPPPGDREWAFWLKTAEQEVQRVLGRLPAPLRREAERLPIAYERRPGRALVRDGVEPDTMGLFVGEAFGDELVAAVNVPPQILLFLDNIVDEADGDETVFREEVGRTYLHELGHYLGLDENGLGLRDLE
jgi:predicted Zn-dependent protease with MMP-like domain